MSLVLLFPSSAPAAPGGSSGAPASLPHLAGVLYKSYTLTCDQGTYAVSGQAANVFYNRNLVSDQGTYTVSGQAATLRSDFRFPADQGTYAFSGQDAITKVDYKIVAAQGSYSIAGQDALLVGVGSLTAEQGLYTLSGQAANLLTSYVLTAAQGSYSNTGQTANLLFGGSLTAAQGTYTVTGQDAALDVGGQSVDSPGPLPHLGLLGGLGYTPPLLTAEYGTYAITGQAAAFSVQYNLTANVGTYSVSGQAASLLGGQANAEAPAPLPHLGLLLRDMTGAKVMVADTGVYSTLGSDSLSDFEFAAAYDIYAVTGQAAVLAVGYRLVADSGTYNVAGQAVALNISGNRTLFADQGTYAVTGNPTVYVMPAVQGFYGLAGQSANLVFTGGSAISMAADYGTYALSGQDAGSLRGIALFADAGSYAVSGQNAAVLAARTIAAAQGAYSIGGQYVEVVYSGANPDTDQEDPNVMVVPKGDRPLVPLHWLAGSIVPPTSNNTAQVDPHAEVLTI